MSLGIQIVRTATITSPYPDGFQLLINRCFRPREAQEVVVSCPCGAWFVAYWPVGPEWELVGRVEKWELAPESR